MQINGINNVNFGAHIKDDTVTQRVFAGDWAREQRQDYKRALTALDTLHNNGSADVVDFKSLTPIARTDDKDIWRATLYNSATKKKESFDVSTRIRGESADAGRVAAFASAVEVLADKKNFFRPGADAPAFQHIQNLLAPCDAQNLIAD